MERELVSFFMIDGHLNFKIQMGVAGSIFEPHPSNFGNQLIF